MRTKVQAQSVEVKNEERGEVQARFATMNVRDKDGDMIAPGAFGEQDVLVSAYGHASWRGELPVGKGTITEDGEEAIADLRFFMDTESGREHFRTIKNVGEAGEWSFGFDVMKKADPDEEQREAGIDRIIKKFKVYEVSPVFRGAGVNTATLAVKQAGDEPELVDISEIEVRLAQVEEMVEAIKANPLENEDWQKFLAEALGDVKAEEKPIPTPRDGESESDFMDRCMGDETMVSDFPDEEERAAVCANQRAGEEAETKTGEDADPAEVLAQAAGRLEAMKAAGAL